MKAFFHVLLLCLAATSMAKLKLTNAPRLTPKTIEFAVANNQLSLYIQVPTSNPSHVLMTFDPSANANYISQRLGKKLGCGDIQLLTTTGIPVPEDTILADALNSTSISVKCSDRMLKLAEFDSTRLQRFLSVVAPHDDNEYPYNSIDILGNTLTGGGKYLTEFLRYHWGTLHPFQTYPAGETGMYHLNSGHPLSSNSEAFSIPSDDEVRIAMASDWGAGTYESAYVAAQLMQSDPHWTLHLGDVYYIGTEDEVRANVLGIAPDGAKQGVTWPWGSRGSFAFMGNHEMYSRAYGYFDLWLPTLGVRTTTTGSLSGQKASYVDLENKYWRILGLDSGYNTYTKVWLDSSNNPQPDEVIDWLTNVVKLNDPNDNRGLVILSHHQAISAFQSVYLASPTQLADLIPANRTILWLWGHEHRLAFYEEQTLDLGDGKFLKLHSRCVGNSGFPTAVDKAPSNARDTLLKLYDDRAYMVDSGIRDVQVGFNGYMQIKLLKNSLTIEYRSLAVDTTSQSLSPKDSSLLVTETFVSDQTGNVQLQSFVVNDPNLTVVDNN